MQPTDPTIDKNKREPNCLKCGIELIPAVHRGWKYCSKYCSKLYLKAQYKKRNLERVKAYNRNWRGLKNGYAPGLATRKAIEKRYASCERCGSYKNLQACHIRPHWAGGTNTIDNFLRLCQSCHYHYDNSTREFWKMKAL